MENCQVLTERPLLEIVSLRMFVYIIILSTIHRYEVSTNALIIYAHRCGFSPFVVCLFSLQMSFSNLGKNIIFIVSEQ